MDNKNTNILLEREIVMQYIFILIHIFHVDFLKKKTQTYQLILLLLLPNKNNFQYLFTVYG